MPFTSIEDAEEWRVKTLDPTKVKAYRAGGNSGTRDYAGEKASKKSKEELEAEVDKQQLDLKTGDADTLFRNARALKMKSEALQSAAEYDKFIGLLVEKSVVGKMYFEDVRQFRDGLMTCSRRISPEIVGKKNVIDVEKALNREFRSLLEIFANKQPDV